MKILIATGIYPPDIGGPATYSKILNDELPRHGIGVNVLSFGKVRRLPKIIRHLVYFLKVLRMARNADIVFSQDPVSVGLPSVIAAKILRKKFILKIVGDYAWEQFQNQKSKIKNQNYETKFISLEEFQNQRYDFTTELRRKIERWVVKRADKIIVPSEYLKKIMMMWGVPEEKIKVIYNAFDPVRDNISNGVEAPRKINLSGTILISAGRLVPWKGFNVLVEIMPEIIRQIPDAKLYIIGDGPEKENLKSQISNLKINDMVFLVGSVSHEDLLNYLCAGNIFVLNTGYEGFSHQILEAMAMEIPVITTNVGGNPELITNNESGILIEYNNKEQLKNAILKLYKDKGLREKFIKNAKEKIKEFGKERMVDKTIDVLNSV